MVELFAVVSGTLMKCEVSHKNFKEDLMQAFKKPNDTLFIVDMLGFDGVVTTYGGVTRFVPVL